MEVKLLNRKQEQLGIWEAANGQLTKEILNKLSLDEDFTMSIEDIEGSTLYIAIDRGLYTMLVRLGDDEFYDYVAGFEPQEEIEFIEGGQKVRFGKQYLASSFAVREAIDYFFNNPDWIRTNDNWQRQI